MKSLIIGLAATFVMTGTAVAQNTESESVTYKRLTNEEVPATIVASIEKDFPEGTMEEVALIPARQYAEEWTLAKEESTPAKHFAPDKYTVSLSGRDINAEAVYSKEGKLLHYKEVIKDEFLPKAIRTQISEKYPGYAETANQEVIKDGKHHTDYYKVKVKKGNDHETLYFSERGELVSTKKT